MPDIRLPDGSIARFPDEMSDAEITTVLRKHFRPNKLPAGESLTRPNGATVTFDARLSQFIVRGYSGSGRGFRQSLDAALDLADSLPAPPHERKPSAQPKPTPPQDPAVAEAHFRAEVECHIRRSGSAERQRQRDQTAYRRTRNRGTT